MPNIGPAELLLILVIALIVFGPRKLPELGKSLGAGLREFRRSTQGLREELEGTLKDAHPPGAAPVQTIHAPPVPVTPQAVIPPAPVPPAVAPQPVSAVTPPAEPAEPPRQG